MKVHFVVLLHDERKLFNICTHATTTEKQYIGAKYVARKARETYTREHTTRSISGVFIAMINTNYQGWRDEPSLGQYETDNDEYIERKKHLIDFYENIGYTNVGLNLKVSFKGGHSDVPASWNSKFNASTMTKAKVMEKIDFINLSLQLEIPREVYIQAYMEIVSNRHTVGYTIDSMLSLLRFVREKMLSVQIREAA